jgi:hypothetical protein
MHLSVFLGPLRFSSSFPGGLRRLHRFDAGDGRLKLLGDPCVEALAGNACRQINLAIKLENKGGHTAFTIDLFADALSVANRTLSRAVSLFP